MGPTPAYLFLWTPVKISFFHESVVSLAVLHFAATAGSWQLAAAAADSNSAFFLVWSSSTFSARPLESVSQLICPIP